MSDEKKTFTEDVLGEFGFRVVWSYLPHWADFKVYEINGRYDGSGEAIFGKASWKNSSETVTDVAEAEPYMTGSVKWDGCSHLDFGRGGYLHFCGMDCYAKHCALMKYLWEKSRELVGKEYGGDAEKWSDYDGR